MTIPALENALDAIPFSIERIDQTVWVKTDEVDRARENLNAAGFVVTRLHDEQTATFAMLVDDAWNRIHISPKRPKAQKISLSRGCALAFIGPDGAGKSTLVEAITEWLRPFSQTDIYLGHGDVVTETWQRLARSKNSLMRRNVEISKPKVVQKNEFRSHTAKQSLDPIRGTLKDAAAVARASRKANRLRQLDEARKSGAIVIADRFPDPQVYFADGAEIGTVGGSSPFALAFGRIEKRVFERFDIIQPDIVFKLKIDAEVAWARKKENTLDELQTKIDAVEQAEYPGARVVDVNANEEFEKVFQHVKNEIAALIQQRPKKIEFVGLPGVGKSTLANAFVERLNNVRTRHERQAILGTFHANRSRVQRGLGLGTFAAQNRGSLRHAIALALRSNPTSNDVWRRLLFLVREIENTAIFERQTESTSVVEIHDQHLLQEIWSTTFLNRVPQTAFETLLRELRPWLPDLVVYLECPASVVTERMEQRLLETGPTGDIDQMHARGELDADVLETSGRTLRQLVESVQKIGIDVVRIDASKPLDLNIEELENYVSALG